MDWTFFLLIVLIILAGMVVLPIFSGAPWHPLLPGTIRRILNFAEIKQGETICDLGCGEGRVLVTAAKEYSARGVGIEIDPIKVGLARMLAKFKNVDQQVKIIRGNIFEFDPQDADVVYLYLTHQAMDRLFPEILKKLKPTVRIVSYRFCIRGMTPEKVSADKTLFLYQLSKGKEINSYT
ncbi:MAG: class I SAM-dependent methyltransferase [Nitrospinae bacterium]|nr:class I SAM-dependent methyltransferase [Nitrospinota bacterium]